MPRSAFTLVLILLMVGAGIAAADDPYPTRPLTIVVPFPPGGLADVTARPLAAALERALKQPVVVTNKQGAAGAVGMQSVAVAKPDGYTLLLGLVSISILPEVSYMDADEFRPWWDRDAQVLAGIVRRIGRVESKQMRIDLHTHVVPPDPVASLRSAGLDAETPVAIEGANGARFLAL